MMKKHATGFVIGVLSTAVLFSAMGAQIDPQSRSLDYHTVCPLITAEIALYECEDANNTVTKQARQARLERIKKFAAIMDAFKP